jgi:hypothetical protein
MKYSGMHAYSDMNCPIYQDKGAIQELRAKEGLSFFDIQRKFLETKPRTLDLVLCSNNPPSMRSWCHYSDRNHSFPDQAEPYFSHILSCSILQD